MTERLLDVSNAIGLSLNAKTTKIIRYNVSEDDSSLNFVEIDGEVLKLLSDTDSHSYLGKLLYMYVAEYIITEFKN